MDGRSTDDSASLAAALQAYRQRWPGEAGTVDGFLALLDDAADPFARVISNGTIARSCMTPGTFFSFRRSQPQGSELTPVMSLPVNTATTPGWRAAAAVSILRIFAWA